MQYTRHSLTKGNKSREQKKGTRSSVWSETGCSKPDSQRQATVPWTLRRAGCFHTQTETCRCLVASHLPTCTNRHVSVTCWCFFFFFFFPKSKKNNQYEHNGKINKLNLNKDPPQKNKVKHKWISLERSQSENESGLKLRANKTINRIENLTSRSTERL